MKSPTSKLLTTPGRRRAATMATTLGVLLGGGLAQACGDSDSPAAPTIDLPVSLRIVSLSGEVDPHLPEFGASIGDPNNRAEPGLHPATGRREINWDGVPPAVTNTDAFPGDFFNVTSPRGLVYQVAAGTGLRVSDNNFADVNPTYGTELIPFSDPRMFAPIGTNLVELQFRIPGTETAAAVQSFGAVVVDVDLPNTSRLQAYDRDDNLIADVAVPTRADPDEYSLVGVTFETPVIARVVLILGDTPIGAGINDLSSGGTKDVVVLDDFLYSEPQPLD